MRQARALWIAWTLGAAVGVGACGDDDASDEADAMSGVRAGGEGGASAAGSSSASGSGAMNDAGSGGRAGSAGAAGTAGGSGASADAGADADAGAAGSSAGSGGSAGGTGGSSGAAADAGAATMTFFVTSTGSATADLGGLQGADLKSQDLAAAAGHGDKIWRAYLSVEQGPENLPGDARDRIGAGPWHNADGVLVAADLTELHAREGDPTVFLDETGEPVPGQWQGSPTPNVHDILTGTNRDGTLNAGYTCEDWTSASADLTAWVGHSDGLGPQGSADAMYRPWNSVHENGGCNDTAPRGGGGRIYCFAADE